MFLFLRPTFNHQPNIKITDNEKFILFLVTTLSFSQILFSQDPIYDRPVVKTTGDSVRRSSTDSIYKNLPLDKVSLGLGLGMDFGGIGGNFLVYPQKNIGVFAGAGLALAGVGYNIGVKVRSAQDKINFFGLAMYGYNAVVKIENASEYDKIFYGATLGFGIDIHPRKSFRRNYLTLALLIPLRKQEVDDYIDDLKENHNVEFKNDLIPIGISIGYRILLQ